MSDKRFRVCVDSNNGVGLYDNSVRLIFIKFNNKEDAVSCKDSLMYQCDLMNELYDENEQLAEENKELKSEIKDLKFENEKKYRNIRQLEQMLQDVER